MFTDTISGPRAWRADSIDEPGAWYYPLGERCLSALDRAIGDFRATGKPPTDLRADDALRDACSGCLRPVLDALEEGRGFAVITGLDPRRHAPADMVAAYWLVGQLLGEPFAQNVQGTLLYDVRDEGQDVRYGARFSVTNNESSFHTDNSFGDEVLDYVGLLCLNPAKSGGLSQVVSGYAAHNQLLTTHRDAWEELHRPFHVDRRGGVRPGESPTARYPVMEWHGRELLCRYLRFWIEAGHEKAGEPLSPDRVRALDVLDGVLNDPALRVEFALRPGEMFFINNRWIFHNRTAFEDFAEPAKRRHYVRLWLRRGEHG